MYTTFYHFPTSFVEHNGRTWSQSAATSCFPTAYQCICRTVGWLGEAVCCCVASGNTSYQLSITVVSRDLHSKDVNPSSMPSKSSCPSKLTIHCINPELHLALQANEHWQNHKAGYTSGFLHPEIWGFALLAYCPKRNKFLIRNEAVILDSLVSSNLRKLSSLSCHT